MRARTGKAVTDMDTPRNSEKTVNETVGLAYDEYIVSANAAPDRKGTTMLAWEIAIAVCVWPRRSFRSSSSPTRNMKSTTPTFEITPRKGAVEEGRRN